MARKSRRANIVQEKKEELHISTPIITKRQLATATYARLSVDKEKKMCIRDRVRSIIGYKRCI